MKEENTLDQIWVCLDCYYKGRLGTYNLGSSFHCPKCHSENNHPVEQATMIVPEYVSEIGTKN